MLNTCPMHPEVLRDTPGICPQCGMNLIKTKVREGSGDKHAGHSTNIFKTKFWVSFFLSIPVVAYSDIAQVAFGYSAPVFAGSEYLPLLLSSIIFFYGGWIFIIGAYRELKARSPGMMTLIGLAISVAYSYSLYAVFFSRESPLFWELSTLIAIMLLGHWMEMRAVSGAQSALKELSKLLPDTAEVLKNGETKIVPVSELVKGDIVLVKPGGRIPADGEITEGVSEVNESMVTGESKPVVKSAGSGAIAGTINGDGALKIRVTKIGEETFLFGIMRLVEVAQASKSRLQLLSDKAAYYLTLVAVVGGSVTFFSWLVFANVSFAIERMVAVFVIACPHALGLAIPLVASISTTMAAKNGFLVKRRLSLETAREIETVLFDKTGTLTLGEFGVSAVIPGIGKTESDVLVYSASVNFNSEHPLAKASVNEAQKRNLKLAEVKNFKRIPGKGVQADIGGRTVYVGSKSLAEERKVKIAENLEVEAEKLSEQGKTVNFVMVGGETVGIIALSDVIRRESYEAIKTLKEAGIKTAMITGDSEDVAKWVADSLGIDEYFAGVLPGEKSEKVKLLQSKGLKVAMVGDGINDAPALAQADLGVAIGAGTNIAIESAGIILVRNDPRDIVGIIKLSKMTYAKMIQNLFWAAGYNVVALPLAAGVLAFMGIILQPALAALLMSLSTVIVAINAIALKRKKLT